MSYGINTKVLAKAFAKKHSKKPLTEQQEARKFSQSVDLQVGFAKAKNTALPTNHRLTTNKKKIRNQFRKMVEQIDTEETILRILRSGR